MTARTSSRAAGPRAATAAAVTVTTVGVLPVFLVGLLSVQLRADLGFGPAVLGGLATAFFAASAASSFLVGPMVRRWGSVAVVRLSAVVAGAAMAVVALLARDVLALSAALVVAGWANGVGQPASNDLIARAVPPGRLGLAYGLKQAAIPLGTLLAGVAIPLVAIPLGWRWAFGLAAALALLVAGAVPRRYGDRTAGRAAQSEAAGPFRRSALLVLATALMLGAATGNAMAAFFVASAVESGIAPGTAGVLAAVASGAGVATRVLIGWLADRVRGRWLLVVAGQMAVGGVAYGLLGTGREALLAAGVVIGYCSGWAWAGLATYAIARMHPDMTAQATAITQGGVALGAALGPLAFGAVVAAASYAVAWAATAVLSLLGALVCVAGRVLLLRDRPALVAAQRSRRPVTPPG